MEFAVISWPEDDRTLQLDHREFSYAGKFVQSSTGKAVARCGETIVAAASFSPDRTAPETARIRTVTVREDRQGEGIGSRLLAGVRVALRAEGYEQVCIAANNPHAYQAAYRAGFAYTGDQSGLAELVLCAPPADAASGRYREGLEVYANREDLPAQLRTFIAERRERGPPAPVDPPQL